MAQKDLARAKDLEENNKNFGDYGLVAVRNKIKY
jgi:hypothetical protein